MTLCH